MGRARWWKLLGMSEDAAEAGTAVAAPGPAARLRFLISLGLLLPPTGNPYERLQRAPTGANLRCAREVGRAGFYGEL